MNVERIDELIALAAFGELSDAEQHELERAARLDPTVAAELDEALTSAAAMQAVHAEEPPPALRASVLASISATSQEPAERLSASPEPAPTGSGPVSLDVERQRRRLGPMLLAAAAAVVLVVGGALFVATNDGDTDPIAAVVDAPDASSRVLDGEIGALRVTYSASEGALVVEGDGVPVLDATATYQLWLVGDDGATSVGVFRPDADGNVAERFGEFDPSDFVLGVTEEPAGGSESPTLPILASA